MVLVASTYKPRAPSNAASASGSVMSSSGSSTTTTLTPRSNGAKRVASIFWKESPASFIYSTASRPVSKSMNVGSSASASSSVTPSALTIAVLFLAVVSARARSSGSICALFIASSATSSTFLRDLFTGLLRTR